MEQLTDKKTCICWDLHNFLRSSHYTKADWNQPDSATENQIKSECGNFHSPETNLQRPSNFEVGKLYNSQALEIAFASAEDLHRNYKKHENNDL